MRVRKCSAAVERPKAPKLRVYSFEELQTSAPEGVYRADVGFEDARWIVVLGQGTQTPLILQNEQLFAASSGWISGFIKIENAVFCFEIREVQS